MKSSEINFVPDDNKVYSVNTDDDRDNDLNKD